jgi:hypothetical protein
MGDPLFDALHASSDWMLQASAGVAWSKAAPLVETVDPEGGAMAWGHAARSFDAYVKEYDAHAPASRWDYSYRSELAEARDRAARPPPPRDARDGAAATGLCAWARHILAGRFTAALAEASPTEVPAERALLAVLALACRAAERNEDAERLEAWGRSAS